MNDRVSYKALGLWVALVACIMVTGLAYHTSTNITHSDVAAYHRLRQALGTYPAYPGDLIAISRDGSSERICGLEVDGIEKLAVAGSYSNRLGRILPTFDTLVAVVVQQEGTEPEPEDWTDGIRFSGALYNIDPGELPTKMVPNCECEMARRLMRNEKVCTVHRALVERGELVRGVHLGDRSNFPVARALYESCGLPYDQEKVFAMMAAASESSCTATNFPWDVRMRQFLRLIRESREDAGEVITASAN